MLLVAHQEGGFSLFHLFGNVSDTFQLLLVSNGLFCIVSFFTSNGISQNVLTCKFTMNQFHVDLITKDCKHSGITNWNKYCKVGQLLFKSGAIITK